jgi:hypothetical protein
MEYSDYPSVEDCPNRNITFREIKWLSKERFEAVIKNRLGIIYPYINETNELDKRIYIGKTVPKAPPRDNSPFPANRLSSLGYCSHHHLEIIGNVYKTAEKIGKWKLVITHNGNIYEIEDDFLILNIEDPNAFFWRSNVDYSKSIENNFNNDLFKYALRAAVDNSKSEYIFIGRTFSDVLSASRPKYYSGGWYNIESSAQCFGKITHNTGLLLAPYKNIELGFDRYQVLCLKATPAPLKILCRSAIRTYLNYSQEKIKSINKYCLNSIPDSLISFLKYPSYLKVGEFLLINEKLVHEDDKYEIFIDENTRNLIAKYNSNSINDEYASIDSQKIIAYNVNNIWLHRFHTIFYDSANARARAAYMLFDKIIAYKFCINPNIKDCSSLHIIS